MFSIFLESLALLWIILGYSRMFLTFKDALKYCEIFRNVPELRRLFWNVFYSSRIFLYKSNITSGKDYPLFGQQGVFFFSVKYCLLVQSHLCGSFQESNEDTELMSRFLYN